MNLYLLMRRESAVRHDEFNSFLVRARDEAEARWIASLNAGDETAAPWLVSTCTTCHVIEPDGGDAGIIISSFNAG